MDVDGIVQILGRVSDEMRAVVALYERGHRNREQVIAAAERSLARR
jgi:hypothetical protein